MQRFSDMSNLSTSSIPGNSNDPWFDFLGRLAEDSELSCAASRSCRSNSINSTCSTNKESLGHKAQNSHRKLPSLGSLELDHKARHLHRRSLGSLKEEDYEEFISRKIATRGNIGMTYTERKKKKLD